MRTVHIFKIILLAVLLLSASAAQGDNIDPDNTNSRFAYAENIGWLNFAPSQGPGVQVSSNRIEGFLWAENIGWINLSPQKQPGVINDGVGNLSGFAYGENVGWVNFAPTHGGVTIFPDGRFHGWAYGENIGWINFDSKRTYNVRACTLALDDLLDLAEKWLISKNYNDFAQLAQNWLDFCPQGWKLK